MRSNLNGFVLFSIALVLAVVLGMFLISRATEEARVQQALAQLQENEQIAQSKAAGGASSAVPTSEPRAATESSVSALDRAVEARHSRTLLMALVLTALTAFGLAGYSYRLAAEGRHVRDERDRMAVALQNVHRAGGAPDTDPRSMVSQWESRLLEVLRTEGAPTVVFDQDARVLQVSPGFTAITGYTGVDIANANAWLATLMRTPESELPAALEAFRNLTRGDIETRTVWTRSGDARTWLCLPLEAWPFTAQRALVIARAVDITAQTSALQTAREEADDLRIALNEAEAMRGAPPDSDASSSQLAEMTAKMTVKEAECSRLAAEVRKLEAELASQANQVSALRTTAADYVRRLDESALHSEEHHTALAKLEQQLQTMRQFAEQFEESLWLADPRVPRLIYATRQAEKLRGRPLAQMMEDFSQWFGSVHEEDRPRVQQAFTAAAVAGTFQAEYRVVREDGSVRWVHDRAVAVRDTDQQLRHLAGITADITVRRNAENMMRSTLAALKCIVDQAPAVMWVKNAQGRYVFVNREYERLTDLTAEQLRGKSDFDLFPRAIAESMHENDVRVLAANTHLQFEECLQHAGDPRNYAVMKFPAHGLEASAGALCGIGIDVTERRSDEDALRAEASRYRAMADGCADALLAVRDTRVVYANAAAVHALGYETHDDLVGMQLSSLKTAGDAQLLEAAKALSSNDANLRRFDARIKGRDRREIEVEVGATAIQTPTERIVQFTLRDIGPRNDRLRGLEQSEAFLRNACDESPAALRVFDASAQCIFANRRWREWIGSDALDEWRQRIHAEDRARLDDAYGARLRDGEYRTLEYRLRDGSGSERWMLERVVPRRNTAGELDGFAVGTLEFSDRKMREETLRAHRDHLAAALEQCPASLWVGNADGSGYGNRACLAWLGARAEAKARVDLLGNVHPEDVPSWREALDRCMHQGTVQHAEIRIRRADGAYRSMQVSITPIPAETGSDIRYIALLDDVTDRRATERERDMARERCAQIAGLIAQPKNDALAQVRQSAEAVRLLFPGDAKLQQTSSDVLAKTQHLDTLVAEMLATLRTRGTVDDGAIAL